jgi:hypothetical protein
MAQRKIVVRFAAQRPSPAQLEGELRQRTGLRATITLPGGVGSGTVTAPPCRPVDIAVSEDAVVIYADVGRLHYLEETLLSCLVGLGGSYTGKEAKSPTAIRPWESLPWWERRRR